MTLGQAAADGHVRHRRDGPGPQTLEEAADDERPHEGRQPGHQQSGGEQHQTGHVGTGGTVAVGVAPATTMPTRLASMNVEKTHP